MAKQKKTKLIKVTREDIAKEHPEEFQQAMQDGRAVAWLDEMFKKANKAGSVGGIKVEPQRIYKMDRERFVEIWVEALKEGFMGEWMVDTVKAEFDKDQQPIGGILPEFTWAKCKAKMAYYKREWKLNIPHVPHRKTEPELSKEQFKRKWADVVEAASVGAEERRKANEG